MKSLEDLKHDIREAFKREDYELVMDLFDEIYLNYRPDLKPRDIDMLFWTRNKANEYRHEIK